MPRGGWLIGFLLVLCVAQSARADWTFRRPIEANWDPAQSPPTSLAIADFYTAGHSKPDGSDIRVTTDAGALVPSHVLMVGPGDRVRIVFTLERPVKNYFVYFGDPTPPSPALGLGEFKYDCGLHLEMKRLGADEHLDNREGLEDAWDRGLVPICETLIPEASIGFNPFGPEDRTVSRVTGTISAPVDGEYAILLWAREFASLSLDGKPVSYAGHGGLDPQNHVDVKLSRGPHQLLLYHVSTSGDGGFLAAWKTPNSQSFERIGRREIAAFHTSTAGPLEENGKPVTADFSSQNMGEAFFADSYSYHYKLTAHEYASGPAEYNWDFGDGQTASGAVINHVYLVPGVFAIKLTVRVATMTETQTTRFSASRLWEQIDHPPAEPLEVHAGIASRYDLSKLSEPSLCRAIQLFERTNAVDPMLGAAALLAKLEKHENANLALAALEQASRKGMADGRGDAVMRFWKSVRVDSDLHDGATIALAEILVWRFADFDSAVRRLQPLAGRNEPRIQRIYAQALILDQKREEGEKIFEAIPRSDKWEYHAALGGAMARTIEYYLTVKDADASEAAWEKWQETFPSDFLQGYGVVLRTRLMELKGDSAAAAGVAEAFALAIPTCSYAPQLLDRASRLLASTNPAKSSSLRQLLKQKYPEDPLSQ